MMMGGCAAGGGHGFERESGPPPGMGGPGAGGPGRVFISPMGEPFRFGPGMRQPQVAWFDGADTNRDGALTPEEFRADAARFFAVLDRGHDGEIDPTDMDYYETVLAPEIRVAGPDGGGGQRGGRGPGGGGGRRGGGGPDGGGGPGGGGRPGGQGMSSDGPGSFSFGRGGAPERQGRQGAGRYSYLDYPQPVIVADRNFNRGVDSAEFARAADERFALLDRNGDGRIERGELPPLGFERPGRPGQPGGPGRQTLEGRPAE